MKGSNRERGGARPGSSARGPSSTQKNKRRRGGGGGGGGERERESETERERERERDKEKDREREREREREKERERERVRSWGEWSDSVRNGGGSLLTSGLQSPLLKCNLGRWTWARLARWGGVRSP